MTDTSKLDFAARQRIYDEEIKREAQFRSMFLSFQEGTPVKYFLNPFRGKRNNAVADQVGGARGKQFLDKDQAFLRSRSNTPGGLRQPSSLSRARSSSVGQYQEQRADSRSNTPLPELAATRAPTPAAAAAAGGGGESVIASNMMSNNSNQQREHSAPRNSKTPFSPSPGRKSEYGGYDIDEHGNVYLRTDTNLYDPTTSEGRSLARMRQSNAVLKPRTQLVGDAIIFDQELKAAQLPPQERYGYPRTSAHQVGWFHEAFNKVDRSPSAGGTRMSTGGYYMAKGLNSKGLSDNL